MDAALGVSSYQRISESVGTEAVTAALTDSFSKAAMISANGQITKQTVMNHVRKCCPAGNVSTGEIKSVPVLHLDADEDHVPMQDGSNRMIPIASIYEGLRVVCGKKNPRRECINVFHHSESEITEDFWDNVYDEVTKRYDLRNTEIYVHCDGAAWIQRASEVFPGCRFVLDNYHKNQYVKRLFTGCKANECREARRLVREAFQTENYAALKEAGEQLLAHAPEHQKAITESLAYLLEHLHSICIRNTDEEAQNGGATEPHVSHVLSSRLSSRPLGWSAKTLEHLVPMLAEKTVKYAPKEEKQSCIPKEIFSAAQVFRKNVRKSGFRHFGLVDPDKSVIPSVVSNGLVTGTYELIKSFGR